MKKPIKMIVEIINHSLKVDANSTSTFITFQPKLPQKLNQLKKSNDK